MARFYASEITSAIAHMHALGFVHRDIKASNVVLCGAGHAKLVDLGCAKQLEPVSYTHLTLPTNREV